MDALHLLVAALGGGGVDDTFADFKKPLVAVAGVEIFVGAGWI